jgi:hypothetical protein
MILRVANIQIPLSQSSFRYELHWPAVERNYISMSIVQWFEIPASPEADKVFSFARMPEMVAEDGLLQMPCEVLALGNHWRGRIMVQEAGTSYKAMIVLNEAIELLSARSLRDIESTHELGADSAEIVATAKTWSAGNWPAYPCAFPTIYNPGFYGDQNTTFWGHLNNYDRATQSYLINVISSPAGDNRNALSAQPYMNEVLTQLFALANLPVSGALLAEFADVLLYSNYDLAFKNEYSPVKAIAEPFVFATSLLYFDTIIQDELDQFDGSYYLPISASYVQIYLSFDIAGSAASGFLVKVYQGTDLLWEDGGSYSSGTYVYSQELSVLPVDNIQTIWVYLFFTNTGASYTISDASIEFIAVAENDLNRYDRALKLGILLPKLTAAEFLKAIGKRFGAVFFFGNNSVEIGLMRRELERSGTQIDLTHRVVKDSGRRLFETQTRSYKQNWGADKIAGDKILQITDYTLRAEIDSLAQLPRPETKNELVRVKNINAFALSYTQLDKLAWQIYGYDLFDIDNCEKSEQIDLQSGTLTMSYWGPTAITPALDEIGRSASFQTGYEETSLKFYRYFGMQPDLLSRDYPLASATHYDVAGDELGGVAIRLTCADSLHEQYVAPWDNYLLRPRFKLRLDGLNAAELHSIVRCYLPGTESRFIRIGAKTYIPIETVLIENAGVIDAIEMTLQ